MKTKRLQHPTIEPKVSDAESAFEETVQKKLKGVFSHYGSCEKVENLQGKQPVIKLFKKLFPDSNETRVSRMKKQVVAHFKKGKMESEEVKEFWRSLHFGTNGVVRCLENHSGVIAAVLLDARFVTLRIKSHIVRLCRSQGVSLTPINGLSEIAGSSCLRLIPRLITLGIKVDTKTPELSQLVTLLNRKVEEMAAGAASDDIQMTATILTTQKPSVENKSRALDPRDAYIMSDDVVRIDHLRATHTVDSIPLLESVSSSPSMVVSKSTRVVFQELTADLKPSKKNKKKEKKLKRLKL